MEGVPQDLAGVGSGVSLGLAARWAVAGKIFLKKKSWLQERSREPSPAPDCLQRKIETLRSHPTEIFNFMVVGGTPRLGGCLFANVAIQCENMHQCKLVMMMKIVGRGI